ncbi:MAG: glutaredoxin [Saprospiraceae bacterium]|nr:glutaredoxin [Candidatus Opimibacter iunctus]
MRFSTALVTALFLLTGTVIAQKEDIEIFEKKDGNKNIVIARNVGKVSYQVNLTIDAKGMDITPGIAVEAIVPAGYMKELATLTPRPGEAWSYGYDVSYSEYVGQAPKETGTPSTKTDAAAKPTAPKPAPQPAPAALSTAPIIVFTQVGCGRCSYVKKEMTAKGIPFEEVDVNSGSPEVNNMWKQLRDGGFTGDNVTMPVVRVNGQLHYNIKDLAGFVNGLNK